jgi:beta-N-acetylhexosaminidase
MSLVGLNMNMAPVLDVGQPNLDAHLVGRCFSDTPSLVTSLGKIVITALQEAGIMAVGKHFPGLGGATMDPHVHLPTIDTTLEEMQSIHLPPFAGAIEAHVSAIMSSHAVYPAFAPGIPATVSTAIITHLLREKMGFDGLVISDDLEMGAIANQRGVPEGAADAFTAGVDLLLVCSRQAELMASIRLIRDKLLEGAIAFERLEKSLERVKKCKDRFLSPPKKISLKAVETYFQKGAAYS